MASLTAENIAYGVNQLAQAWATVPHQAGEAAADLRGCCGDLLDYFEPESLVSVEKIWEALGVLMRGVASWRSEIHVHEMRGVGAVIWTLMWC
jgi:hypothetical protein